MVCMKHPMLRVKATFVLVKSSCLLFGLLDLHFCLVNSICHHFSCLHPLSLLNHDVSLSNPYDSLFLKIKSTCFSTSNSPPLALQDVDLQRWDLETIQDPLRRKHWDSLGLDLEGAAIGDGRNLWKFSWMEFKMMFKKGASCQKLAGYWCFPEKIWFVQNTLIEIQSMMKIQVLTTSNRGFLNHQCKDQLCGGWIFMIFLGIWEKDWAPNIATATFAQLTAVFIPFFLGWWVDLFFVPKTFALATATAQSLHLLKQILKVDILTPALKATWGYICPALCVFLVVVSVTPPFAKVDVMNARSSKAFPEGSSAGLGFRWFAGCQEVGWLHISDIDVFNIAMENGPFIDDFPYEGFSMAIL